MRKVATSQNKLVKTVIAVAVAAIAVLVVPDLFNPARQARQKEMQQQFEQITILPGSSEVNHYASHKQSHIDIGHTYSSSSKEADIEKFFAQKLLVDGWSLCANRPVSDWFKDLGGKSVAYCKGNRQLTLQTAGDKAIYNWAYSLNLREPNVCPHLHVLGFCF